MTHRIARHAPVGVLLAALVAASVLIQTRIESTAARADVRPDVIVIVTDDQRWDTMSAMPLTSSWLPTSYPDAFVANPACCPSRTTILTGTYSHENGVWANRPPYGGWPAFEANGWVGNTIADALHASGYRTAMLGKFLNGWRGTIPPGWDLFAAHLHARAFPGTYLAPYYDYTLRVSKDGVVTDENHAETPEDYSTTVIQTMATEFIRSTQAGQPLFLYFAPSAPHSARGRTPPIPAPRDLDAPVTPPSGGPGVNEVDVSDKPRYIARREPISTETLDRWREAQLRSLLSVDRAIDDILATVAANRDISNTLVIFISDNGFANGSHRWFSKGVPYEEAIRVPMLARFDGVLAPGADPRMAANVDIAPTIADATGVDLPAATGRSLLRSWGRDSLVLEGGVSGNHAFCGVRTGAAKYVKYASGEEEFYDLVNDPFELTNVPNDPGADALRDLAATLCTPLPPEWPRPTL